MLKRSRGCLGDSVGEVDGPALGNDDRAGAAALSGANDGAEVVRVLDPVKQNQNCVGRDSAYEIVGVGVGGG